MALDVESEWLRLIRGNRIIFNNENILLNIVEIWQDILYYMANIDIINKHDLKILKIGF